ncbi:MAG: twin-arginine translocation pathway signal, partial [Planctomycetaceae bacterium]|nr:twin-arginine translocation pathway signal [Planctomycetaceae bacterium]
MTSVTRRLLFRLFAAGASLLSFRRRRVAAAEPQAQQPKGDGSTEFHGFGATTHDRVWLGEHFWANPMEDWRIADGAAEVQSGGGDRNVHLITHQLTNP